MRQLSRPWVLCLAGGVLLVLCVSISEARIHRISLAVREEFREQSLCSIDVFTRLAGEWLEHGELDAIRGLADVLIAGSGLYVVIATAEEILVDRRDDVPSLMALDLSVAPAALPQRTTATLTDTGNADVLSPIGLAGYPEARIGYVRVGLSGDHAASEIRSRSIQVRGLAYGGLVIAMALVSIVWLVGRHGRSAQKRPADSGRIRCGELMIDTDACTVTLFGETIDLTPKMYELVLFLARRPGVTFSDADLLAALWADSPYAASGDVKQCIYMVRQRFDAVCEDPKRLIANVKGFGYRLVPPTSADAALRND